MGPEALSEGGIDAGRPRGLIEKVSSASAQGLSQEQLGERADLHWTHISGIERAQYDLKLSTLTRVSRGLGVSLSALFAGIVAPRARRKRSPSVATGVRSSHRARR